MTTPTATEVFAEHGLKWNQGDEGRCLCGYWLDASDDPGQERIRRMHASHQLSKLSEHGYSIVPTPSVEWFILKGGFFKQQGRIYSGPYIEREDTFCARNTIERIEDTHEYFIDSRLLAAAAAAAAEEEKP